jgi:predicted nucleic acid-binding protein
VSFVLDASVALAWCFEDEQTGAIMALLERVVQSGAVAPLLWPVEVLNRLPSAERRGGVDGARREQPACFLQDLPISIDDETVERLWRDAAPLAVQHGLTAYDAIHLELALRRALPLASSDKKLITAARQAGVAVLPTA